MIRIIDLRIFSYVGSPWQYELKLSLFVCFI